MIEPFETIIDYVHKRVVLIRLDAAGRRLVQIPAYTPSRTVPLLMPPTGMPELPLHVLALAVQLDGTLDTLDATHNIDVRMLDNGAPQNYPNLIGYPFLNEFGIFGINQRTHQFILYRH